MSKSHTTVQMEQKLFTFIENQITIEEKSITFDEFFNKETQE